MLRNSASDRKSVFRAGFRPDYKRESPKIGPPAGGWIWKPSRLDSERNPARKPDFLPGSTTGVCEIKAVLTHLTMSRQPLSPIFQCWRACLCEHKAVRNKSRILREDGAEQGNIEIGETGFTRKPKKAIFFERLLFRKYRYCVT